jgi:hypothetical protein
MNRHRATAIGGDVQVDKVVREGGGLTCEGQPLGCRVTPAPVGRPSAGRADIVGPNFDGILRVGLEAGESEPETASRIGGKTAICKKEIAPHRSLSAAAIVAAPIPIIEGDAPDGIDIETDATGKIFGPGIAEIGIVGSQ